MYERTRLIELLQDHKSLSIKKIKDFTDYSNKTILKTIKENFTTFNLKKDEVSLIKKIDAINYRKTLELKYK